MRYKLWWSEKDGIGVGILVKKELCEKVEVQKKGDRVTTMVLVFEKEVIKIHMCVRSPGWKIRV